MIRLIYILLILLVLSANQIICGQTSFNALELDIKSEIERIQKQNDQNIKRQKKSREKISDKIRKKRLKHISDSTAYADYIIELSQVTTYGTKTWPTYKVYPTLKEAKKAYKEPYFSGGYTRILSNLSHNFRQPYNLASVFSIGTWGYITIKFMVDDDGNITRTKVKKGIDPEVDYELELAIKRLPQLYPGEFGGKKYPSIGTMVIGYDIVQISRNSEFFRRKGIHYNRECSLFFYIEDYNITWTPAITPMIL